jgi:hypothetical protein
VQGLLVLERVLHVHLPLPCNTDHGNRRHVHEPLRTITNNQERCGDCEVKSSVREAVHASGNKAIQSIRRVQARGSGVRARTMNGWLTPACNIKPPGRVSE